MKIGVVSDSLAKLPFDAMLDATVELGFSGVEVNTGGWSTAPHVDLAALLENRQARHAADRPHAQFSRQADRVAQALCLPVVRATGFQTGSSSVGRPKSRKP